MASRFAVLRTFALFLTLASLETLAETPTPTRTPTPARPLSGELERLRLEQRRLDLQAERLERLLPRLIEDAAKAQPPAPSQPQPNLFEAPLPGARRGIDARRDRDEVPFGQPTPPVPPRGFLGSAPGPDLPLPPIDPTPAGDKSPIDDDDNLLVDVGFGLKGETADRAKALVETRLSALAFAINSVNTTSSSLLTVDELRKQIFPGGTFKASDVPTAKIDLRDFLSERQIRDLRGVLSKEPLNCANERKRKPPVREDESRFRRRRVGSTDGGLLRRGQDTDDDQPKAEPLRADVIVKAMIDQENYYKLLGVSNNRTGFEIDEGVGREFDADGLAKDQSEDTLRLILPPGTSGVAHPNSQRLIVVQKGRNGLVIRTGDVSKNEATRANRNFIQHPGTARPSGSEEIWELPNGMRAYSARNGDGNLVGEVPHGLVQPKITNPRSCFSCHGDSEKGFIAMQNAPKKKVNVVDEVVNGRTVGNRNLFRATWDDYDKAIAPANARYEKALEKSGASRKAVKALLDQYAGDVSLAKLANEVGGDPSDVENAVMTRRFRSAWDPSGEFDPKNKDAVKNLLLSRDSLETEVDLGAGAGDTRNKKPLYCAVKDLAKEQQAKLSDRFPKPDAVARGNRRGKPTHDAL